MKYKKYEKILGKVLKDAECKWDSRYFSRNTSNRKKVWEFLNEKLKNQKAHQTIRAVVVDGNLKRDDALSLMLLTISMPTLVTIWLVKSIYLKAHTLFLITYGIQFSWRKLVAWKLGESSLVCQIRQVDGMELVSGP